MPANIYMKTYDDVLTKAKSERDVEWPTKTMKKQHYPSKINCAPLRHF